MMRRLLSTSALLLMGWSVRAVEKQDPAMSTPQPQAPASVLVDLKSAKVSFVAGKTGKISGQDQAFKVGDLLPEKTDLDTGTSLATEVRFEDGSVMRLGAQTKVSFLAKDRVVRLDRGVALFYSPEGNGGITMQGGKVAGQVSGSTVIGTMDAPGNFSFFVLESSGAGQVISSSGVPTYLGTGEGTTIRIAGGETPEIVDVHIDAVRDISPLFQQIPTPLPSDAMVIATTQQQGQDVQSDVKLLSSLENYKLQPSDPEGVALAMICAVGQDEMGAAKNILLRPLDTAAGTETSAGDSSGGSPGASIPIIVSADSISALLDARQPEASLLISSTSPPPGLDGIGGTSTSGGGAEDPSNTDTAAGGNSPPDTQPPPTLQPANTSSATPF